jgi:hypothetical protein
VRSHEHNEGIRRHFMVATTQSTLNACFNLHIHYFNAGKSCKQVGDAAKNRCRASARFDFLIPEDRLVLIRYPLRAGPGIRQSDPPRFHIPRILRKRALTNGLSSVMID